MMLASELINKLQTLIDTHGDLRIRIGVQTPIYDETESGTYHDGEITQLVDPTDVVQVGNVDRIILIGTD